MISSLLPGAAEDIGTLVHIGAGQGGDLSATLASKATRILLVEADEDAAEELRAQAGSDARVEVIHAAVTDAPGPAQLIRFDVDDCNSLLEPSGIRQIYPRLRETGRVAVPAISFADLAARAQLSEGRRNWLVLEAPGQEMLLLAQAEAAGLLARFGTLVVASAEAPLYVGGGDLATLRAWCEAHSFTVNWTVQADDPALPEVRVSFDARAVELDQLRAELQNARQATAERDAKIKALSTEAETLRAAQTRQSTQASAALAAAQAAQETTGQEVNSLREDLKDIRRQKGTLQAQLTRATNQFEKREAKAATLLQETQAALSEAQAGQARAEAAQTELDRATAEIKTLTQALGKARAGQARAEAAQADLDKATAEIKTLTQALTKARADLAQSGDAKTRTEESLRQRLAEAKTAEAQIKRLTDDLASATKARETLTRDLEGAAEVSASLEKLQGEHAREVEKRATLEKDFKQVRDAKARTEEALKAQQAQAKTSESALQEKTGALEKLQGEHAEEVEKRAALEKDFKQVRGAKERTEEALRRQLAQTKIADAEIERLTEALEAATKTTEALTRDLEGAAEVSASLEKLQGEHAREVEKRATLEKDFKQVRDARARAEEALNRQQAQARTVAEEVEQLTKALAEARQAGETQRSEAQAALDKVREESLQKTDVLDQALKKMRDEKLAAEEALALRTAERGMARAEVTKVRAAVEVLRAEIAEHKTVQETLNQEVAALKSELSDVYAGVGDRAELERKLARSSDELLKLEGQIDVLRSLLLRSPDL